MLSFTTQGKEAKNLFSILLVDDNRMVSSLLKSSLEKSGYMVHQVFTVEHAENAIFTEQPDLILLDISQPNNNGLSLCRALRSHYSGPITMLSNRDSEREQIEALALGADDYLIKPITFNLLKAKIDVQLRHLPQIQEQEPQHKVEVGDISIYPLAQKCKVKGESIRLSRFEFQLLLLLLSNAGKVLSRDQIYTLLLGREYNGLERTIDVRISTLRDKLASKGMEKAQIETVWGKGYILNTSAA